MKKIRYSAKAVWPLMQRLYSGMKIYNLAEPGTITSPIILSVPHSGIHIPDDMVHDYKSGILPPDDTDWFADQLYFFATQMGIQMITANISRWVIDLNRNPDGKPLYNDGRVITALCPATDFNGNCLYNDERKKVSEAETARRRSLYFDPYHDKISELINVTKQQFGKVLLWDCHSIRRSVPAISNSPFPDMILGTVDGNSAPAKVIEIAMQKLTSSTYQINQNHPFKGGYITRNYGKPNASQFALQLEMTKDLYMDDTETKYDETRAKKIQQLLAQTLERLTSFLLTN